MGVKVADHVGRSARDKYSRPRHVIRDVEGEAEDG